MTRTGWQLRPGTRILYISVIGEDGMEMTDRVEAAFEHPNIKCQLKIKRAGTIMRAAVFDNMDARIPKRTLPMPRVKAEVGAVINPIIHFDVHLDDDPAKNSPEDAVA